MATADSESTRRRLRSFVTPLTFALGLAVLGLALVVTGLAWGVAPWVAMVVLGVLLLGAAFLVDSPRRGSRT